MNTIYFDNQASTPLLPHIFENITKNMISDYANPHSSDHALGWESGKQVDKSLTLIGNHFGWGKDEVIITSGATEANNLAILGYVRSNLTEMKKRIITTRIEHKSVLEAVRYAEEKLGCIVEYVGVSQSGHVDLDDLRDLLDNNVLLVSIGAVNSEIGTIQSLSELSKLIKEYDIFFHSDAAQALACGCFESLSQYTDAFSLSAHKIYGPKGVGALLVGREWHNKIEPMIYGGQQQNGLRSGTMPTWLCVGLAEAINSISVEKIEQLSLLRNNFVELVLNNIDGSSLNGSSLSHRHPGNANIRFDGIDARQLLMTLQPHLCASLGSACSSGTIEPSYVLREIGLTYEQANSSIRFSFGELNTTEEVHLSVDLLKEKIATIKSF